MNDLTALLGGDEWCLRKLNCRQNEFLFTTTLSHFRPLRFALLIQVVDIHLKIFFIKFIIFAVFFFFYEECVYKNYFQKYFMNFNYKYRTRVIFFIFQIKILKWNFKEFVLCWHFPLVCLWIARKKFTKFSISIMTISQFTDSFMWI